MHRSDNARFAPLKELRTTGIQRKYFWFHNNHPERESKGALVRRSPALARAAQVKALKLFVAIIRAKFAARSANFVEIVLRFVFVLVVDARLIDFKLLDCSEEFFF